MSQIDYEEIDSYINNFKLEYKDFNLTKLVRDELIYQIKKKNNTGTPKPQISKQTIKRLLIGLLETFLILFKEKRYWVFSNADRRKLKQGVFVDRVTSIVSEVFPNDALFIENSLITKHKKPTKDIILSESFFHLLSFIIYKIIYKKKSVNINGSIKDLEDEFDVQLNIEPSIKKFIGQYYAMKCFLAIKKKPKMVFMAYPNGYYGYVQVFKEKNIPIIELQHGIIYKEHPSYNYRSKTSFFKPDFIFTYGKKDKECLEKIHFLPTNKIFTVGSYMLDIEKGTKKNTTYIDEIIQKIGKDKKIIVVTTTIADIGEMILWAENYSNEYEDYFILILPRIFYKSSKRKENNFIIVDPNKTTIYELLKNCDAHVTQVSTCALEALFFNKPSFIYETNNGQSSFRRNFGYIKLLKYFTSNEELHQLIKKPFPKKENNINVLFENNAIINFQSALITIETRRKVAI